MPSRVNEVSLEAQHVFLYNSIAVIFQQASENANAHRKNYVSLHKIHNELAKQTTELKSGRTIKLTGEKVFVDIFLTLFLRAANRKKGEAAADRLIKFVGGYVRFSNEKALEQATEEDEDEDTPASRFTTKFLKKLLVGLEAKDKNTRYRCLQTINETISHLGPIDEDIYTSLRSALVERLNDKEVIVRSQAVLSLSKLCISEEAVGLYENEESITDILLFILAHDPAVEVRRVGLANIPIDQEKVLPAILARTRDIDAVIRKLSFDVLGKAETWVGEDGRPIPHNPLALSIAQRELIVKCGIGDREEGVRDVAAHLMGVWYDIVATNLPGIDDSMQSLLEFLKLFDLKDGKEVASSALNSVLAVRSKIVEQIDLKGQFLADLNAEKAFLARNFVEFCKSNQKDSKIDAAVPVVKEIAFRIQDAFNTFIESTQTPPDGSDEDDDNEDRHIVLHELLQLAVFLDYADELGRRQMTTLVRCILEHDDLPIQFFEPCLNVMRQLCNSERNLILLIVEIIHAKRDEACGGDVTNHVIDPEYSIERSAVAALRPQEVMTLGGKERADEVNLRCLELCIAMLECVNGTFEQNMALEGILQDLILPSIRRPEPMFRKRAVKCLGLYCLISKHLAIESLPRFLQQLKSETIDGQLKLTILEIIFDTLLVHEKITFKGQSFNFVEEMTKLLMGYLEHDADPTTQALVCKGAAKLVFSGIITDLNVIKNLIKAYISPSTMNNQHLRQCLAVFLPTYSHASSGNQHYMQSIFYHVFLDLCEDRRRSDGEVETGTHIKPAQLIEMFVEWTDPNHIDDLRKAGQHPPLSIKDKSIHLDLAQDMLKILFRERKQLIQKDCKRALCQHLNKLYLPDEVDDFHISSLKILVEHIRQHRPLRDSVCNTALIKFETTLNKKYEKQLEGLSEEELRQLEDLNDLFEFLDSVIPLDEEEVVDRPRRGRKRRSESFVTSSTSDRGQSASPSNKRKKLQLKRQRVSTDGDASGNAFSPRFTTPAPGLSRPSETIVISSDDDEDHVTNGYHPVPNYEAELDEDLLESAETRPETASINSLDDSIMGPEDSDSEEEVHDLLANNN